MNDSKTIQQIQFLKTFIVHNFTKPNPKLRCGYEQGQEGVCGLLKC